MEAQPTTYAEIGSLAAAVCLGAPSVGGGALLRILHAGGHANCEDIADCLLPSPA